MRAIWEFQRPTVRDGAPTASSRPPPTTRASLIGHLHPLRLVRGDSAPPPKREDARSAKRPRDLEAKPPLVVAVVHPDPRKPQRAALVEPARQRAGGDVAGATRGLDHAVVVVAVRRRDRLARASRRSSHSRLRTRAPLGAGRRRPASSADASACGGRSPSRLPRAGQLLPGHGHELALVRPPTHWSMPGHDIGSSLPAKAVGTKTVPGRPRRDRIGNATRSPSGRRRRTSRRAPCACRPPHRLGERRASYPRPTSSSSCRSNRSGVIERSAGQLGLTAW